MKIIQTVLIFSLFGCSNFIRDVKETEGEIPPTIIFDANGGTIAISSQRIVYDEATSLMSAKSLGILREGYSFAGWAEEKTADEPKYSDSASISLKSDITLYAVWYDCDYITTFSNLSKLLASLEDNSIATPYRIWVLDLEDDDFVTGYYQYYSPFDKILRTYEKKYVGLTFASKTLSKISISTCDSLTAINIPYGVKSLYFHGCKNLSKVNLPDSLTSLTFYACNGIKSVDLPTSIIKLDSLNFFACENLESIEIPNNVTYIGSRSFAACTNLKTVVIGNGVTDICSEAFYSSDKIETITFKDIHCWFYTTSSDNWKNHTGGTAVDVSNPATNANRIMVNDSYYWYKVE